MIGRLTTKRRLVAVGAVLAIASGLVLRSAAQDAGVAPGPYYTTLSMQEFMGHVMQHAAEGVWDRAGTIYTETGEVDLTPVTDEAWEEAESAALLLAETTNGLLLPGRKRDDGLWRQTTEQVRAIALEAAAAAEARDPDAWWDAGAKLYPACQDCHQPYVYDLEE